MTPSAPAGREAEPAAATPAGICYVWLATTNRGPFDVLGVFGSPERAKRICQDAASEYFGEDRTPALAWRGDDTCCSASHYHPGAGAMVFAIDMYELDKVQS